MLGVMVGAGLVLSAVVALLGRHAYLTFPEVVPRGETELSPKAYAAVRIGVVAGGAIGAVGAAISIVDTAGTIADTRPGERGVVGDLAVAIPEWAASAGLYVGAAVLAGCALLALASELRARLASGE